MTEPAILLSVADLSKRFDSPDGGDLTEVLRGVTLELRQGETAALMGPSGSGKTTLLQLIGTLDRPTSGAVRLEGRELAGLGERELAEVRNRRLGFVFQSHHLLPQCTVWENVLVPTLAGAAGASTAEAEERARRLLGRVGLAHRLAHRPGRLSGGERQRVAVVRALVNAPALVLADEPTGALDRTAATQLAELLLELNREEGTALLVATHARDLAMRMGRVYELVEGRLRPFDAGAAEAAAR
ncbi:MAG: ABC transporter ATP-binding protein [Planctomycetes bacterium]|nr:ABC transporter ATP-binding protein [Planctomycetota bacterium]